LKLPQTPSFVKIVLKVMTIPVHPAFFNKIRLTSRKLIQNVVRLPKLKIIRNKIAAKYLRKASQRNIKKFYQKAQNLIFLDFTKINRNWLKKPIRYSRNGNDQDFIKIS
jgi:hypothetical protein